MIASNVFNKNRIPNRWLISAHNIRHGFGTHMVNNTDASLWEVSKSMGHSSVEITERIYVENDPRAGVDHLHKYGPNNRSLLDLSLRYP